MQQGRERRCGDEGAAGEAGVEGASGEGESGIAQTAAADEKEKDSRAELLRSMDPKEQERILKEVLREFLS